MILKRQSLLPKLFPWLIIGILSIFSLFPFWVMFVMGTFKTEDLWSGLKLWPGNYLITNLINVFSKPFARFYLNSFYIALFSTIGGVLLSSLAGFAFAKFKFRGKNLLFVFVLATLMIPSQLGLIGFVIEMRWLSMVNTHLPLILPPMASAFGVFWMTQYIKSAIPNELIESAQIDGAADFGVFARMIVPNITPALLTIFLVFFLWSWNSYLIPLILLNKEALYTVILGISTLDYQYRIDYGARILALSIATLPIVVFFAAGSRYFVQGMMMGSVKG